MVRARTALEASDSAFWHSLQPQGPFRTALARSFTPDEIRRRLDACAADPDAMATTVRNFVSRHDLGALLADDDRFRPLVDEHSGLLTSLAIEDLWEERRELGTTLLGTVETAEDTAGELARCAAPEAGRLVADVITGAVRVPRAALAEVARANPTTTSPRKYKSLGVERVAALLAVARTHDDPRLRVLAARVLELAADARGAAVAAWTAVRSPAVDDEAWFLLARHAREPIPIREVPEYAVLSALRGEMAFGYVWAEEDFANAELAARRFAATYDRVRAPRTRAGLLADLGGIHYKLVVKEFRKHPVPTWRAFLEGLLTPREDDPPLVRELSRRVAMRRLASLNTEVAPGRGNRAREVPIPKRKARPAPADWVTAVVDAAADSAALLDLVEIYEKDGLETEVSAPSDAARTVLRELVDTCPDSRAARLASELLLRASRFDDLLFVLRRADRLAFDDQDRLFWMPDLWERAFTAQERARLLALVSDPALSPPARVRLIAEAWHDVPAWEQAERPSSNATLALLTDWYENVTPGSDGGLAEIALERAIDDAWDRVAWEREGAEEFLQRIRAAVERVPAAGPRLRLLRLLRQTDEVE